MAAAFAGGSLLCGTAGLVACGSSAGAGAHAAAADSQLPIYGGSTVMVFDDRIEPGAVGLADAATSPRADVLLRDRVGTADLVSRGRISTVTVDTVGGDRTFHVSFVPAGDPFVSRGPLGRIELSIRSRDPAFGVVKTLDNGLIGMNFIGFFRRFAGTEEPDIHFHLAPDNADVVAAVRDAAALQDLRR